MAASRNKELRQIARNLPAIEKLEIRLAGGNPEEEILEAFRTTEAHIYYTGGKAEAAFGLDKATGQIWCLASLEMQKHPRAFLEEGKKWIGKWRKKRTLWNFILDSNEPSKRWLERMGAEFSAPMYWRGHWWRKFEIRREEECAR